MWLLLSFFLLLSLPPSHVAADPPAPEFYTVVFDTDIKSADGLPGSLAIEVTRALAPLGADRFYALVGIVSNYKSILTCRSKMAFTMIAPCSE